MSLTVSPRTGHIIKVGSKEFGDLLRSPTWQHHFTSPHVPSPPGTATPINEVPLTPLTPLSSLPPLPMVSTGLLSSPLSSLPPLDVSLSSPSLSIEPLKPLSVDYITPLTVPAVNVFPSRGLSSQSLSMQGLPSVPTSPTVSLPAVSSLPAVLSPSTLSGQGLSMYGLSMHGLPPVPTSPVSPRSPVATLPPVSSLPSMQGLSTQGLSIQGLSPVPASPVSSRSPLSALPRVPTLPTVTPVSSLPALSMQGLPPVPSSPVSLPGKQYPSERVDLPSVSVPTYKVWSQVQPTDHIDAILSLPVYDIPTLEEVLAKTTQPFLRERLQKMIAEHREREGRGIKTRGWGGRSPQKGRPRHELMAECGSSCFLKPDTEGFPICPKCEMGDGKCICAIDCGGVMAAYNRARQWKHEGVADLAQKLLQTKCKDLSAFTPSK